MTGVRVRNPEAVSAAIGGVPGISTRDGVLVAWPDGVDMPTQQQVDAWEAAYRPVPATVTALAGKFVLMDMGLLDTVEAMIAAHEYRGMRLFWTATVWERANPYLTGMALELELTDEQVDDMFRAAEVRT
jgi:hypothetical protein